MITELPTLVNDSLVRLIDGELTLLGSRCEDCGEHYFPQRKSCTRCFGAHVKPCDLGSQGTLWSWTTQAFLPKTPYDGGESPNDFKPFGVGYIEMATGLKVEARLTTADPAQLRIGMAMELALDPYRTTENGPVYTFAFGPVNRNE